MQQAFLSHCTHGTVTHSDLSCYCIPVTYMFPVPEKSLKTTHSEPSLSCFPEAGECKPSLHASSFLLPSAPPEPIVDFLPFSGALCFTLPRDELPAFPSPHCNVDGPLPCPFLAHSMARCQSSCQPVAPSARHGVSPECAERQCYDPIGPAPRLAEWGWG